MRSVSLTIGLALAGDTVCQYCIQYAHEKGISVGLVRGTTSSMWKPLADEPTSNVRFSVIRDYNGKPVRNASVVLHPVNKKGKQERNGLQLKTDAEGNTNFDGVPYGPLRIQVLAPGFQTYGDDFDISKPETQITIKLKRPVDQYSTYGSKPQTSTPPAAAAPAETKPEAKPEATAGAKPEVKARRPRMRQRMRSPSSNSPRTRLWPVASYVCYRSGRTFGCAFGWQEI